MPLSHNNILSIHHSMMIFFFYLLSSFLLSVGFGGLARQLILGDTSGYVIKLFLNVLAIAKVVCWFKKKIQVPSWEILLLQTAFYSPTQSSRPSYFLASLQSSERKCRGVGAGSVFIYH